MTYRPKGHGTACFSDGHMFGYAGGINRQIAGNVRLINRVMLVLPCQSEKQDADNRLEQSTLRKDFHDGI